MKGNVEKQCVDILKNHYNSTYNDISGTYNI